MKKSIFNILKASGAFALLAASCLFGQSGPKLIATVPFDFRAAKHAFPAGEYTVIADDQPGLVWIRGQENEAAISLCFPADAGKIQEHAKLVFKRYGDRYFLSQVWPAGRQLGRELAPTKAERELARTIKPEIVSLVIAGMRKPAR